MFYLIRSSVTTLPADTADFLLSLLRACPVLQLASRRYVCQRFSSPVALLPITATITLPVCCFRIRAPSSEVSVRLWIGEVERSMWFSFTRSCSLLREMSKGNILYVYRRTRYRMQRWRPFKPIIACNENISGFRFTSVRNLSQMTDE